MNPPALAQAIQELGEPSFRLRQILSLIGSGVGSYEEMSVLPLPLRQRLNEKVPLLSLNPEKVLAGSDGLTFKARLRLGDGKSIETVLMQPKPGFWSVCVSSQVGCALRCSFCATGLMGLARNLSPEEITDQVLFWRQWSRHQNPAAKAGNVVYMGMGEPMLNFDNVKESIAWLTDPLLFNLGRRHITVSSAGVVAGLDRFTDELPQINLALSLHAATETLRSVLVPINKAYPLEQLALCLKRYFLKNKRKVFIEYVLLDKVNDTLKHAQELVVWLRAVGYLRLLHVNLIAWNPIAADYQPSPREQAQSFKRHLIRNKIHVTIRKNLGQDIDGACGQLVIT